VKHPNKLIRKSKIGKRQLLDTREGRSSTLGQTISLYKINKDKSLEIELNKFDYFLHKDKLIINST
jgi:hypothetical protein